LVDLLTSVHAADSSAVWSSLKQRGKKAGGATGQSDVSVGQALINLVHDNDHVMRMHMAGAVTTLFLAAKDRISRAAVLSESWPCDRFALLSCALQEETFQQIMTKLQLAFVINNPNGLDDLSGEDESVNRFASRIYTLLMCGCVSPVCERKVMGELVMAVGRGIDPDLVTKVSWDVSQGDGWLTWCG
jgi:hypothetical protein